MKIAYFNIVMDLVMQHKNVSEMTALFSFCRHWPE